jgi:hypothetical protein
LTHPQQNTLKVKKHQIKKKTHTAQESLLASAGCLKLAPKAAVAKIANILQSTSN